MFSRFPVLTTSLLTAGLCLGGVKSTTGQLRPTCGTCRFELKSSEDVTAGFGDSIWVGRIAGFAVDRFGRVYIADVLQHHVLRLDSRTRTAFRFGKEGRGPGEFLIPQLIAPLKNGGIAVFDPGLRRVTRFDDSARVLGSFQVPVPVVSAWSMIADSAGNIVLSAVAAAGAGAGSEYPIHVFNSSGKLLRSFGPRIGDIATPSPLYGSGGPIAWDDNSRTYWYSHGGSGIRLEQYDVEGRLIRRTLIAGEDNAGPTPRGTTSIQGGKVKITPRRRTGTIALFALPRCLIVNVSVQDTPGLYRYDVIRASDGSYVASWQTRTRGFLGFADSQGHVYGLNPIDEPFVVRYRTEFPYLQRR